IDRQRRMMARVSEQGRVLRDVAPLSVPPPEEGEGVPRIGNWPGGQIPPSLGGPVEPPENKDLPDPRPIPENKDLPDPRPTPNIGDDLPNMTADIIRELEKLIADSKRKTGVKGRNILTDTANSRENLTNQKINTEKTEETEEPEETDSEVEIREKFAEYGEEGEEALETYGDRAIALVEQYGEGAIRLLLDYGEEAFDILEEFGSIEFIPIDEIRSSQAYVSDALKDGTPLDDLIEDLRQNGWDMKQGGIVVVEYPDGRLVAIDHRRLVAANEAAFETIPSMIKDATDTLPPEGRNRFRLEEGFEDPKTGKVYQKGEKPSTWGEAAVFRAANQRAKGFPDFPLEGSPDLPIVKP
ncbi:MAG: hypothetical protein L0Y56_01390, partial [Nitrospira sp.]|nr:hypothetical protein [Nitrospira sp.]